MNGEKHDAPRAIAFRPGTFASAFDFTVRPQRSTRTVAQLENWIRRSEKWACLMVAAQAGQNRAYAQLLVELDAWLRRYYARRLPRPAAEDARQEALLAIHVKRHTYVPTRSFGAWVAAIARHKWIDCVRDASRSATQLLFNAIPMEDRWDAAISAFLLDDLLRWLSPSQATVIRLVKLEGLSIEDAAQATGQSTALVKVNIHRGLRRLASLATCDATTAPSSVNSSRPRCKHSQPRAGAFSTE